MPHAPISLISRVLAVLVVLATALGAPIGMAAQGASGRDAGARGADVPMLAGNPARTGAEPGPGPNGAPAFIWSYPTGGQIESSPAVVNGRIYVGSDDGQFYSLDATDGFARWHTDLFDPVLSAPGVPVRSSPAVDHGIVYFASDDGNLYAVDALNGRQRWRYLASLNDTSRGPPPSLVVVSGVVYLADGTTLDAVDATTGRQRWRFSGCSATSLAVAGGLVYASCVQAELVAVDAATGRERWRFDPRAVAGTPPVVGRPVVTLTSPAVAQGMVYVGSDDGSVDALDSVTGAVRWQDQSGGAITSPPAVAGNIVYFGSNDANHGAHRTPSDSRAACPPTCTDGDLYAVNAATGEQRWVAKTGGEVRSTPTVADGVVYAGGTDGELSAIDAVTGAVRWRLPVGGALTSSPAVVNGMIVVGSTNGVLYAFAGTGTTETPATIPLLFPSPVLPQPDRRSLFEAVWRTINTSYLYPDFQGVDWQAVGTAYRQRALRASSSDQFYAVLEEMVLQLGNLHAVFTPPWTATEEEGLLTGTGSYVGVGVFTAFEPGDLLVGYVFPRSPAARAGLRPRDRIVAVDGRPVGAAEAGVTLDPHRYTFGLDGQPSAARRDPLHIRGPAGTTVRLTVRSPEQAARDVTVTRQLVLTRVVATGYRLADAPDIGYLRIPTFEAVGMDDQVTTLLQRLLHGRGPLRGLIIDLRANPGGLPTRVLGQFVSGTMGQLTDRAGDRMPVVVGPGSLARQLAAVPLVVLVDGGSASGSEWFAGILQARRRARVVGTRTPGVVEDTEVVPLPGGATLRFPAQAFTLTNGTNLEGKGVTPDVVINVDWTRYPEAQDPQIQRAVKLLHGS